MAPVRFGLIGYGAWGRCHARAIQATSGCELRAVCAATEESRKAAATETGAAIFAAIADLLDQPDIDVVDIVLPNHLHEQAACAALRRGKHVLLEKPMATSIASCDGILGAARSAGRLLLVGHEMRLSTMYAGIRKLIDSGRIGEPRYVLIDLWRRPYRSGAAGWRLDPARVGNWILEEPVHHFDIAAWYLDGAGYPASVFAYGNRRESAQPDDPDMNDNFTAMIRYRNRAYAVISQSLAATEHHLSIKIFGSKAVVRGEWHAALDRSESPTYSLEMSEGDTMKLLEIQSAPGEFFELQEEIAAMARAVREGAPLPITPEEARRAVMLCLAARRSLEMGDVISLT